jgi:predicted DNA-binding transcriptional regulator AlpA
MTEVLLRFSDLKRAGIVRNHVTLTRWIEDRGFPPGIWLGPNTHVWPKQQIDDWLAKRPSRRQDATRQSNGGRTNGALEANQAEMAEAQGH